MPPTIRWRALTLWNALNDASPVGLFLVGCAIACTFGYWRSATASEAVRYAGTALQIFGLATVAIGLSKMRRLFGQPSFLDGGRAWFRQMRAVFARPKTVALKASVSGSSRMSADLRVVHGIRPGASLEDRILALEKNLDGLRDELDANVLKLRRELDSVHETIEQESAVQRQKYDVIDRKIEEVAVGGLHLESVGLLWLVLGVLGASIPDEIAGLLHLVHLV
jgi:hypothetical protein